MGVFVGRASTENQFNGVVEDGFAVMVTNQNWDRFWEAFIAREPFFLKGEKGEMSFSVEWVDQINIRPEVPISEFYNPVDRQLYAAKWRTVNPEKEFESHNPRVEVELLRVITDEHTSSYNIEGEALGAYSRRGYEEALKIPYGEGEKGGKYIVQITLSKDEKPKIEMASEEGISPDYLDQVYKAISAIPGIHTKKDEVVFQLNFLVK
ncbi:MAG: hypothetical protein IPH04_01380 [Saprospirales bacterium]|nr:hypothetical protein [Saprospirales bacterium]